MSLISNKTFLVSLEMHLDNFEAGLKTYFCLMLSQDNSNYLLKCQVNFNTVVY